MSAREAIERFRCFGSDCGVYVIGDGPAGPAERAARHAGARLMEWHEQFSRFLPESELSRLNADPRERVPVSPLMARLAGAVREAGELSGGLVDGTLVEALCRAGYEGELGPALELRRAMALAPARRPAGPAPRAGWRLVRVDGDAVVRPPGVAIDSGGLAKGLFADVLAQTLAGYESFAIDCGGDLRIGGAGGMERSIDVQSPFDGSTIHVLRSSATGVATSGIGRRAWQRPDGRPAHHLLDPATGQPAYTGVVQATALAPSALLAEILAKAAVLSGPRAGAQRLRWGGVLVLEDGAVRIVAPNGSTRPRSADPGALAACA